MNEENKMTREEAEEMFDYYNGSLSVTFDSYYKFSFTFLGENDDVELFLGYGGNHDDIYRYNVNTKPVETPKNYNDIIKESWSWIKMTDKRTGKWWQESFDY